MEGWIYQQTNKKTDQNNYEEQLLEQPPEKRTQNMQKYTRNTKAHTRRVPTNP